jgi:hypothetical protein
MRALRKTRLKKNMAQVCWTAGYGNCRAVKTGKTNCMFSTIPTALGKLGQLRPSFPQFPQPLRLDIVLKTKRKQPLSKPKKNGVDKMQSKA